MSLITDRDLAVIEPSVFTAAAVAGTNLLTAIDAGVSGTTLTSATSDFAAPDIGFGHVVIFDSDVLEVVSRLATTQLEVSRPRAKVADDKIAPPAASDKTIKINTFARLIDLTQTNLLAALGVEADDPVQPLTAGDILNPEPLARLLALRTLERAFGIALSLDPDNPSLEARRAQYALLAGEAAATTAVLLDFDGDGEADETRHLQVAVLRRT